MGRDLQFKLLTLVFAFVALIAVSACAVASSPSTPPGLSDSEQTEAPEVADDAAEEEADTNPEPTATPEPVEASPSADDDQQREEADDDRAATRSADDDAADEPEPEIPGDPERLQIDSIDVDAAFEYVGIDDDGNMDVPQEWENVAWYEPGTVPGDVGNSVVAGHYDSDIGPAIFYDLNELEVGDEVRIVTEDGEELVFEIYEIESVHVDDADTSKIFGDTDERNLNLITCEGVWDTSEGMYDHRLIVYSQLVEG